MSKPERHLLLCNSLRLSDEPLRMGPKREAAERGATVVVYPADWWFGEASIDDILDIFRETEPLDGHWVC